MGDNWYDKLTEAEKKIWKLIYYHPTMISSRSAALDLLFCVIGTGLEWQDGEIKDTIDNNYLNATEKGIKSFDKGLYDRAWTNCLMGERSPLSDLTKRDAEFIRAYTFFENCRAEWVWDNIEKLVTTAIPQRYFYPLCKYSKLMQVPKDVKLDWLGLAIETCNLILLCDPTYKTPNDSFGNAENIKLARSQKKKLEDTYKERENV